jgi:tetratricopeptide (TPR) repeat protein
MRTIGIAVLVCALAGNAVADPSNVEQANALFLEGRELLTSRNTKAACEKFEASIALDPEAPGVMLNLGLCYELLEKYATSLYWFRKAQVAAAEASLPAYEDEAKRHTVALATKVPIVRIDASAAPGAEIRIDGKLITPTDYARVEIDRGSHKLEARAPGKQLFRRSFDVGAIDAGVIEIPALVDEPQQVVPDPIVGPVIDPPSQRNRIVLAASLGAGGLALCIVSPLWARHTKNAYDDAVANNEMPSYSSARTKQHVATGMFVGGLGLIGVGAYLYFVRPSTTATMVAPVIDAQHLGIAISGAL